MFTGKIKAAVFLLEGLNAIATTYYFYYLYFFTKKFFGFGAFENLVLGAGLGLIYAFAAAYGGTFAQKRGYFRALKLGFMLMGSAVFAGAFVDGWKAHLVVASVATVGMCFTWPTMQAMISEREPRRRLQTLLGWYNLTWAGGSAVMYFAGGALFESLGARSLFLLPATIHACQYAMVRVLERMASVPVAEAKTIDSPAPERHPRGKQFLHTAWVANPFAYLAINTVIPVIPTLAAKFDFSPAVAGVFCSIWFFARAASFELLRWWPGWHYRSGWLFLAYGGMVAGFATLLLAKQVWMLGIAQVLFGFSVGLIYYSSIFYSMDVGETKGEHGGVHEAMIGVGSCAGPALGALALWLWPGSPQSGAVAVTLLLMAGFIALVVTFRRRLAPKMSAVPAAGPGGAAGNVS